MHQSIFRINYIFNNDAFLDVRAQKFPLTFFNVNSFLHQRALHFGVLNYEKYHKEGICKALGSSAIFSAFYADFCLCPKSEIITTLNIYFFFYQNIWNHQCLHNWRGQNFDLRALTNRQRSIQMEKNEIAVQAKLQFDARNAELWSKQNKMYLNYDKTTCMLIGTRYRTKNSQQLNIYIDNNKIESVNKQKLLGIHIDENLLWSDHIDYLCSNISSKISLLKHLSSYIPFEAKKCSIRDTFSH